MSIRKIKEKSRADVTEGKLIGVYTQISTVGHLERVFRCL
jgi:hypothetical protein